MTGLNKTLREIEAEIVHLKNQTDPDYSSGVLFVGDDKVLDEGQTANTQFNGDGRGVIIQSNPDNAGAPNGLVLRPSDPYDETGSGFNAGYSASIRGQTYDPTDAGTADEGRVYEVGTLSVDTDPDFKFYVSTNPFADAQPVPGFGWDIPSEGWSDGLLRPIMPNTRRFTIAGGSEVTTDEGFEFNRFDGRAFLSLTTDSSDNNRFAAFRFNQDSNIGWEMQWDPTSDTFGFRDFGNGLLPTWDFNGIDGIDLGLPRIATRTDIPTQTGVSYAAVATDNSELVWTDGTERRYVSGTSF